MCQNSERRVFGTPDGVVDSTTKHPRPYCASLVHDALYQFLLDRLRFHRWQADGCFLQLMATTGFTLRSLSQLMCRR